MIIPPEVLEWWRQNPSIRNEWTGVPQGNPYHPATSRNIMDIYKESHKKGNMVVPLTGADSANYHKIEVGCGPSPRKSGPGWIYNDIKDFPYVTICCKASEIDLPAQSVDQIFMDGVFEHFTYREAGGAIKNFARMLVPGGILVMMNIPDAFSYVLAYSKLTFGKSSGYPPMYDKESDPEIFKHLAYPEQWVIRALYGWQRWDGDEHKSYWNKSLLNLILEECFTVEIEEEIVSTFASSPTEGAKHYHVVATRSV
jgi:predicted SAM-dependent methyltransferase